MLGMDISYTSGRRTGARRGGAWGYGNTGILACADQWSPPYALRPCKVTPETGSKWGDTGKDSAILAWREINGPIRGFGSGIGEVEHGRVDLHHCRVGRRLPCNPARVSRHLWTCHYCDGDIYGGSHRPGGGLHVRGYWHVQATQQPNAGAHRIDNQRRRYRRRHFHLLSRLQFMINTRAWRNSFHAGDSRLVVHFRVERGADPSPLLILR
jgi:ribosomal protein L37AE/L43A